MLTTSRAGDNLNALVNEMLTRPLMTKTWLEKSCLFWHQQLQTLAHSLSRDLCTLLIVPIYTEGHVTVQYMYAYTWSQHRQPNTDGPTTSVLTLTRVDVYRSVSTQAVYITLHYSVFHIITDVHSKQEDIRQATDVWACAMWAKPAWIWLAMNKHIL